MIRSPADYMAEWENVPLDPKTKKKKRRVNLEPPRPMAARLITKKQQKYSNRILEAIIAHLQDAGHPIPYSKFSSPKMGRNIAKGSLAVGHDRRD